MRNIKLKLIGLFAVCFSLFFVACEPDIDVTAVTKYDADVSAISPVEAKPNFEITLNGHGFTEVTSVFLGFGQIIDYVLTDNAISFDIPNGTPEGETEITLVYNGNFRIKSTYNILKSEPPIVNESGTLYETVNGQTQITIIGSNFNELQGVKFGNQGSGSTDVDGQIVSASATEIVVLVPTSIDQKDFDFTVYTIEGYTSASSVIVRESLIANGSFEEGDGDNFTGWGKWNGGDRMTSSNNSRAGDRSVKVTNPSDGNAWNTQFVSDPVDLEVGKTYVFAMYVKGDDTGGTLRLSTNESGGAQYFGNHTITDAWTKYEVQITARSPQTRFALDMGASGGTFYIDDVSVDEFVPEVIPIVESLSPNASFEEGDGDEFTGWGKWNGGDRVTASAEARAGVRSAQIVNPAAGNAWDTQFVSDPIATVVGQTYRFGVFAKGDGVTIRLSTNESAGAQYFGNYTVTEDWEEYIVEFTAASAETRLALDMGTSGGTFYIDDVTVNPL